MARNRGKRPGTASGSTSPNQGQTKDKETKTSTAGSTSSAATTATATGNSSVAAKADMPTTTGKTVASSDKTASSAAKSASAETTKPSVSSTTPASSSSSATSLSSAAAGKRPATATQTAGAQGGGRSSENGGFWPGLIGGVIGGAATALAASLFWIGGDGEATTALESRLAAAEQQVGEVAGLTERVTAIEAAPSAGGDNLAARLGSLEGQLAALGDLSSGANGGLNDQLASLQQQVEALAGDLGAAGDAQQATAETLATLETTLADTGSSVEQAAEQTTALGQSVETLNGDVQGLAARVGEAEGRLDHLGGEYQRGAAMIVALGDVNRAITRSEPFDSALESLKLLMRDEAALGETVAVLEPVAAEGVPSLTDLKDTFASMASRALLAEGGNQSLADQVSNNVFGIINMRPSGADADGASSQDMLSRAQARLSEDDLEGTIGELAGLEGGAAEEAKDWVEQAQARLSAEAAVVELRAHAQALVAEGS